MILSMLVGQSGPLWVEIAAEFADKALIMGALSGVAKRDQIKKVHHMMMNENLDSSENLIQILNPSNTVINPFEG